MSARSLQPFRLAAARAFVAFGLMSLGAVRLHAVAFPGAQGYGANATGGSTVAHVSNLNDSGAGSLRDALGTGGRRVVFDVGGTITITSALVIPTDTTIDGTTAPSPGITVTGYNTSVSGRSNIIVRNVRFRENVTGPSGKCSFQGSDACFNIILDHCSIEWGRWDCLEFTGNSHDITIQYCIIGQGIDPQYFGCLIDAGDKISIHHNLWIGNNNRNPKLKGNCQYINNVVYNWGSAGGLQGGHSAAPWLSDVLNNYFIKGPSSANDNWALDCTASDQWFASGNFLDLDKNGSLNGTTITTAQYNALTVTLLAAQQHNPSVPVTVDSASTAVSQAGSGSYGCQPLDAYDTTLKGYLNSYGSQGVIGKGAVAGPVTYQSESGTWDVAGVTETTNAGWTGTSYINTGNAIGAFSEVTVNVPATGSYQIAFRHANGTTTNRPADLRINGTVVQSAIAFPGTGAWTAWTDVVVTKTLNAGNNTIRLTSTTANGCSNLDRVTVQ